MSKQTKSDQPKPEATAEEAPQVESAPLTDTDLETISGGSSIQKGESGWSGSRITR